MIQESKAAWSQALPGGVSRGVRGLPATSAPLAPSVSSPCCLQAHNRDSGDPRPADLGPSVNPGLPQSRLPAGLLCVLEKSREKLQPPGPSRGGSEVAGPGRDGVRIPWESSPGQTQPELPAELRVASSSLTLPHQPSHVPTCRQDRKGRPWRGLGRNTSNVTHCALVIILLPAAKHIYSFRRYF